MVEQALQVLTLHIIWKAGALTADAEPNAEDIRLKESLLSQREALLEKLVEYAIGTQSNTVDTVRRAVSTVTILSFTL
jgi:cohesin complex subunit SA-1/2